MGESLRVFAFIGCQLKVHMLDFSFPWNFTSYFDLLPGPVLLPGDVIIKPDTWLLNPLKELIWETTIRGDISLRVGKLN